MGLGMDQLELRAAQARLHRELGEHINLKLREFREATGDAVVSLDLDFVDISEYGSPRTILLAKVDSTLYSEDRNKADPGYPF